MKSVVDAVTFAAAVGRVTAILKKNPIPQLAQVRVQFTKGACTVSATDMKAWLSSVMEAEGDEFSFVFRNSKKVQRILRHYEGELTLELLGGERDRRVLLRCGDKSGEFPVLEDEKHGEIPKIIPLHCYSVKMDALYARVKSISYATRHREDRPIYEGVRFTDKRVWCVDGFRMAIHEDASLNVHEPFVLPAPALKYLKAFGDAEGVLMVGKEHAALLTSDLTLTCDVIERSDELRIETTLPKSSSETYMVKRKEIHEALCYLADCTNTSEQIRVTFDRGSLLIDGKHSKYCASVGGVDGACEVRYAFNLAYMKQAVEQFSGAEEVRIGTSSAISPIVLTEGSRTAMVLPLRMKEEPRQQAA